MQKLELNSDCDEVTASGAFGYVLLYLDEKPSMRWRFDKSMKLKLVWEKAGHSSKIQTIKSAFSFKKHEHSCFLASDINLETQGKHTEAASSSFKDISASVPESIFTSTHSVAPQEGPLTLPDTQKQSSETTYTCSNHNDIDEDFDMISDSDADIKSESVPGCNLISSKPLCKYCNKINSNSEEEQDAHQRNPFCFVKCGDCEEDFINQGGLLLHQLHSHGSDYVTSSYPQFHFTKSADLDSHLGSNKCPICKEEFSVASSLRDHLSMVHFQEKLFKCCVCGKLIESKNELTQHLKIMHDSENKNEKDGPANSVDSKTAGLSMQVHGERGCGFNESVETKTSSYSFDLKKKTQNCTLDSESKKITLVKENQHSFNAKEKESSGKNILKGKLSQVAKQLSHKTCPKERKGAKTCKLCDKQYFKMTEHFEAPSKKLKCPSCHHFFQSQAHLIVHQDLYHNVGSVEAEETSDSSKRNLSRFSRANITDSGKGVSWSKKFHPCPICGTKLQNCHIVNHIKNMHTKESVFICCTCKKTLSNIPMLKEHIDAHLGIETKKGKWHCSLCPAIFTNQSEFHRHAYTHRTVCVFCNKDFGFIKLLNQHYQQEHWDDLLPCRICGQRLATKQQLWSHERHHKYKKPVPCHICGKSFRYMKEHLASHEENEGDKAKRESNGALINDAGLVANSKKYLCSMCPWTFPSEGWLVRHMTTIHKQDLGLKCPQCPKQFASRTQLTTHVKRHVHKSEKKFVCSVCGKICTENNTLKLHMRIHALEKYLTCSICDQGFNYKVTLKSHMKSKHGIDI